MRQNPSFRSILLKRMGCLGSAVAIYQTRRGRIWPRSYMAYCSACLVVAWLRTEGTRPWAVFSWNDRSKIIQKLRLLCGMAASGDSLRCWGSWFWRSDHRMRWQRPAASCSAMSCCRHGTASGFRADGCGPLSTACCSCWRVHGGPFYVEVNGFDIRRLGGKVGNPRGEAGE